MIKFQILIRQPTNSHLLEQRQQLCLENITTPLPLTVLPQAQQNILPSVATHSNVA